MKHLICTALMAAGVICFTQTATAQGRGFEGGRSEANPYNNNGNYIVVPPGVFTQNQGTSSVTSPNGMTTTQSGGTTYYSNGQSSITNGYRTEYGDGRTCVTNPKTLKTTCY